MKVLVKPQYPLDVMWREAREMARGTVGMGDLSKPVSDRFMREMVSSMHSPIREYKKSDLWASTSIIDAFTMSWATRNLSSTAAMTSTIALPMVTASRLGSNDTALLPGIYVPL